MFLSGSNSILVTVYITTFNRLRLLKRAVDSVLEQDYPFFELIVVDDNSVDGTVEYLEKLHNLDNRIRVVDKFALGYGRGVQHSRNCAIDLANGFFITGLDDDDYFLTNRLSSLVESYSSADSFLCSSFYLQVSESTFKRSSVRSRRISYNSLLLNNVVGSQVLVEVSRLRAVGGFDVDLESSQDLDVWLRLTRQYGPARRISVPSYVQDISHDNERITTGASKERGTKQFIAKYREDLPVDVVRRRLSKFQSRSGLLFRLRSTSFRLGILSIINRIYLG